MKVFAACFKHALLHHILAKSFFEFPNTTPPHTHFLVSWDRMSMTLPQYSESTMFQVILLPRVDFQSSGFYFPSGPVFDLEPKLKDSGSPRSIKKFCPWCVALDPGHLNACNRQSNFHKKQIPSASPRMDRFRYALKSLESTEPFF